MRSSPPTCVRRFSIGWPTGLAGRTSSPTRRFHERYQASERPKASGDQGGKGEGTARTGAAPERRRRKPGLQRCGNGRPSTARRRSRVPARARRPTDFTRRVHANAGDQRRETGGRSRLPFRSDNVPSSDTGRAIDVCQRCQSDDAGTWQSEGSRLGTAADLHGPRCALSHRTVRRRDAGSIRPRDVARS